MLNQQVPPLIDFFKDFKDPRIEQKKLIETPPPCWSFPEFVYVIVVNTERRPETVKENQVRHGTDYRSGSLIISGASRYPSSVKALVKTGMASESPL